MLKSMTVRLPADLIEKVGLAAKRQSMSRNGFIVASVKREFIQEKMLESKKTNRLVIRKAKA